MATSHALLIGGGLFTLALVVLTARSIPPVKRLLAAVVLALLTSGATYFYATQRSAGTGLQISRGFPRPFHFLWRDTEGRGPSRSATNFVFAASNTVVHIGALAFLFSMLPRSRRESAHPTMPAHMLAVRIVLGIFLLILAVIGGLVPILQGWIFFLLAILVLFPKAKFTEKILLKAQTKVPRVVAFLRRMGIGHG